MARTANRQITLSEVTSEETPVASVRRQEVLGPYMNILTNSWENDTAMGVTVDEGDSKYVASKFRAAASELGMGVSIAVRDGKGDGTARVIIQAKEKRAYTPRKAKAEKKAKK